MAKKTLWDRLTGRDPEREIDKQEASARLSAMAAENAMLRNNTPENELAFAEKEFQRLWAERATLRDIAASDRDAEGRITRATKEGLDNNRRAVLDALGGLTTARERVENSTGSLGELHRRAGTGRMGG